jgi:hypothetical protein
MQANTAVLVSSALLPTGSSCRGRRIAEDEDAYVEEQRLRALLEAYAIGHLCLGRGCPRFC